MLSFLTPAFLFGALAAAVPVVLHLLKREPEPRVKFAAVALLKRAPVEQTARRRLRELLLLALRVAALVLLALAFARPFVRSGAIGTGGTTVVALDTSYSMSAPGQFDRAKRLAKDAIAQAPAGDQVGVVTFSDSAEVIVKPTADRAVAAAAIDSTAWGFGSTRYRPGLNAAAQALGRARGTIVVVTDLQENGWDAGDHASIPESARIEVADVGRLPDNLAITAVRSGGGQIIATVRNAGARVRQTRVHLAVDGRPSGETAVLIEPNQSVEVTFPAARGTEAAVTIDDREGLQADNVRYLVLGGAIRPAVLIVTANGDLDREAFYVHQALAAGAVGGRTFDVAGAAAPQLAGWSDRAVADYAAVLLLSTRGLERRGREALASYVKAGGGLVIAVGPEIDGEVVGDVLGAGSPLRILAAADRQGAASEPRTLAPADVRHPIFQAFGPNATSLGLVKFQTVARIGGEGCQTLARFTTGDAALLECAAGEGRALVVASDLNNRWNDFPLHATFVPFLNEAVRYVSGAKAHGAEYLIGDAPPDVRPVPGIVTLRRTAAFGLPAELAGPATEQSRRIAVNVDPRESEPARMSVEEFKSAVTRLKDAGAFEARVESADQEDRQHLWQYVMVIMIGVLALEGLVAGRTA